MTKLMEKTREELTAEIEEGKKKIRQFENREKMLRQKLSVEERKALHETTGFASAAASWRALCRSLLPCRTRMRKPFYGLP